MGVDSIIRLRVISSPYPVETVRNELTIEGHDSVTKKECNYDIVEIEDEPFTFQLGDIVSFGGIEGLIETVHQSGIIDVIFTDSSNSTFRKDFYLNGTIFQNQTESLLKLISRPKKKVKKEVTMKAYYSPSLGKFTGDETSNYNPSDAQLIELKGVIEVDE